MDRFSPKHFAFILLAVSIVSLKTYPTIYLQDGGRDTWIGMIIASAFIFFFFTYIIRIIKKHNCFNLVNVYRTALGKTLGNIFLGLFAATLLLTLIECTSMEANSMHINMFLETPNWYLLLFFIVPSIYTIRRDIVAIVSVTVVGITLIMLAGINLAMLTARYKHFSFLFPVFQNGISSGFLISIIKMIALYGSISISLPYLSRITDKRNKLTKYSIIGLIILIQMQIVSATGMIMTFDIERLNNLIYPKLLQTQLVSYFKFLEFGELYVMLQILGGWLLKYLITFYAILKILKEFNLKRIQLIYATYIISAVVYVASFLISFDVFFLFKYLNFFVYICLINYIIVPLAVFTVYSVKSSKKTPKDEVSS